MCGFHILACEAYTCILKVIYTRRCKTAEEIVVDVLVWRGERKRNWIMQNRRGGGVNTHSRMVTTYCYAGEACAHKYAHRYKTAEERLWMVWELEAG